MADAKKLMPLFLVKPGTVARPDIRRAERLGGVCIVECADPESARYSEPPFSSDIDSQARAALALLRMILRSPDSTFQRGSMTKWFVEALLSGETPQPIKGVAQVKR